MEKEYIRKIKISDLRSHIHSNFHDLPFIVIRRRTPIAVVMSPQALGGRDSKGATDLLDKVIDAGMARLAEHPESVTPYILIKALERRNELEQENKLLEMVESAEKEMFGEEKEAPSVLSGKSPDTTEKKPE